MGRFWELVKKYPVYIAGAVLALVLLIYFMSSSGDSGGTGVNTIVSMGPSDASVAANRDVTVAQMMSNAAANESANQLEAFKYGVDASKVLAGIDAASYELMLGTTKSLATTAADRDIEISKNQFSRDIEVTKIGGSTSLGIVNAQTSASVSNTAAQTSAATNQAQISANAATDIAAITAANNAAIAEAKRQSDYAIAQQAQHAAARATAMSYINAALQSSNPAEVQAGRDALAKYGW